MQNDEEAIKVLYGDDSSGKSKYAKLKYSFKQRLLNMVLLIEPQSKDDTVEKKWFFFHCYRSYLTSYFLVLLGARKVGIPMLEQLLPTLELHEFTVLTLESSKLLRQHYATIEGNLEKAMQYDQYVQEYLELYSLETKVEGQLHILESYYVLKKSNNRTVHELARQYSAPLSSTMLQKASSRLAYKVGMIDIIKCMSVFEYAKAAEICESTIGILKSKQKLDYTGLSIIYFQWIICATQLADFENAKTIGQEALKYLNAGSFNWFKGISVVLELCLKTKNYSDAFHYFREATNHANFDKLSELVKEEWRIYEIYIYLLVAAEKIPYSTVKPKNFSKVRKFLNEVSNFSRDKAGMNVHILLGYLISFNLS
ncbi:MAG: hypothetical protein HC892_22915 [Saprospiraceae bacterium]|nr:hypothetical protein [Saprospiraceae bacterium]